MKTHVESNEQNHHHRSYRQRFVKDKRPWTILILIISAGSAILTAALSSSSISHITILSRRAPYVTDPEISTILIPSDAYPKGFDEFPSGLVEKVKDHQAIIWGLGVSQTQVNKDDYVK